MIDLELKNSPDKIGFEGGFTVLMATYEKDNVFLLEKAILSVIQNSLRPDDFILVIDGPISKDANRLIRDFQSTAVIRVLRLHKNLGLACALNYGLKFVRTEWVIRADSDDYNHLDRFLRLSLSAHDSSYRLDIIGSAIQELTRDGKRLGVRRMPQHDSDIRKIYKIRSPFNHNAVAYRLQSALDVGGYPNIYLKEDYGLWIKMLERGFRGFNIEAVLVDATAGVDLYKRRGGIRYVISEINLQRLFYRLNIKSVYACIRDGIFRSIFFLAPPFLKHLFYKYLLRYRQ